MCGIRSRGSGIGKSVRCPSPACVLGAVALCVLPVFAHGCHRGDHDDEPTVVPVESRIEHVRSSQ
ncbi:hypothetical protein [Gemmata sp.]|uniref:hypothetical protein n=1 Tax=Gemmata sp. TaxID=1914242 RepID=UPI003F72D486